MCICWTHVFDRGSVHSSVSFVSFIDTSAAYQELRLLGSAVLRAISNSHEGEVKNRKLIAIPVQPCKSGPKKILRKDFIGRSQFIYYSFQDRELLHYRCCNCQKCPKFRCVSRYNRTNLQYVLKIKVFNRFPYYQIVGIVHFKSVNDVRCRCESCEDIKEFDKCRCEDNCPNFDAIAKGFRDSFCQWQEEAPFPIWPRGGSQYAAGSCYCCKVPYCLSGQYFHRGECQCKCLFSRACPPGYYFNQRTCRCERPIYTIRPTLGLRG